MIRAVLDVNVIVSALLTPTGTPRMVLAAWQEQRFVHVTATGLILQVREKLASPKIGGSYGVTAEDIRWVSALLMSETEMTIVAPGEVESVTGDPEDDYVLAAALVGRAGYLVTGDRKLVALGSYRGISLLNPRLFLDALDTGP